MIVLVGGSFAIKMSLLFISDSQMFGKLSFFELLPELMSFLLPGFFDIDDVFCKIEDGILL